MIQLTQVKRVSPLRPLQTVSLANKVQGVYRPERNESYMTVNITAKKIQVTQAFSDYATKKIEAKLDRFFSGDADCKVTLSEQKNMNFQRFPTLDAKKLVNAPKMSANHRGICHF